MNPKGFRMDVRSKVTLILDPGGKAGSGNPSGL